MQNLPDTPSAFPGANWSGNLPVPVLGDRVLIGVNRLGWGRVTGFFEQDGYLGVEILLDVLWTGNEARPARVRMFGAELREGDDPGTPRFDAGFQKAVAEVAVRFRDYKARIDDAWRHGNYENEGIGREYAGKLQRLRNSEASREFLYGTTRPMLTDHKHRKQLEGLVRAVEEEF